MASAQRLQRLLRAHCFRGVDIGTCTNANIFPMINHVQTRLLHVRYRRILAQHTAALSSPSACPAYYQGVRYKSDESSDKKGSPRQSPASASDEVNRSLREQVSQPAGSTGQPTGKGGKRQTKQEPTDPLSGADAPHGGSQVGLKPDPARMAKMVLPEWQEASTDAGGYIKLEDIGFDERDVAAKKARALAADERLKRWDPKDTGRRDELPYNLLKNKGAEGVKGQKGANSQEDAEATKEPSQEGAGQKGGKTKRKDAGDSDGEGEKEARGERSAGAVSTQQTVLWESSRRSTSGAQSTSDAGGVGQLTEQLLDRDEADERAERQMRRAKEEQEGREKWKDKEQQSQQDGGREAPKGQERPEKE